MTSTHLMLLEELMALSRLHLELLDEQNWERWERVADKKESIYSRLADSWGDHSGYDYSGSKKGRKLLMKVSELEKEAHRKIANMKKTTANELEKIQTAKTALNCYGKTSGQKTSSHFGIKC